MRVLEPEGKVSPPRGHCACRPRELSPWRPRGRFGRSAQPPESARATSRTVTSGECARTCSRTRDQKNGQANDPQTCAPFRSVEQTSRKPMRRPQSYVCTSRCAAFKSLIPSAVSTPTARTTARWAHVQSRSRTSFPQCLLDPSSKSVPFGTFLLTRYDHGRRRLSRARGK